MSTRTNQNTPEDAHRERIELLYATFADEPGAARVADMQEIADKDFDLNIGRYVANEFDDVLPPLSEATAQLEAALDEVATAERELLEWAWADGLDQARRVYRMSVTQTELENYSGAQTVLRGTIDAGDYKQFIFPLLLFKRHQRRGTRSTGAL